MTLNITETNELNLKVVATKEDIANLRSEFKEDIGALKVEIHASKSEMIRWMFAFLAWLVLLRE